VRISRATSEIRKPIGSSGLDMLNYSVAPRS
jgi:hypothetical protein